MKKNRRNTLYKRMVRMVITIDLMMIFLVWSGYSTAASVAVAEDPSNYLKLYRIFTVVEVIIFAIILTIIFQRIMSSIRRGFKELIDATKKLSIGDIDVTIPLNRNDEFGDLFKEYSILVESTREQARIVEDVSNSNLSVEINERSKKDVLGKSLKKMVNQTNKSMNKIKNAAENVFDDANSVANASQSLAQGSTEQASAIEEVTASIAEVADKTKRNAMEADEAAKLIDSALMHVNDGNIKMQEMMKAMNDINNSSQDIANIIKVIDDIAFQTNILALNAAVEAARAGEAGRGFAVVAEEVRTLAAKSAEAASHTSELIENAIKKTSIGTDIANDTASKFEAITSDVRQSSDLITAIVEASNNQAETLEQIDIAIDQVSKVVQGNSEISETCAEASEKLSNEASTMRNLLSEYIL